MQEVGKIEAMELKVRKLEVRGREVCSNKEESRDVRSKMPWS